MGGTPTVVESGVIKDGVGTLPDGGHLTAQIAVEALIRGSQTIDVGQSLLQEGLADLGLTQVVDEPLQSRELIGNDKEFTDSVLVKGILTAQLAQQTALLLLIGVVGLVILQTPELTGNTGLKAGHVALCVL